MKLKTCPFKKGQSVYAVANYKDEQCGEYAKMGVQIITDIKRVTESGTSGWWVKTDCEDDWVDAAWFKKVSSIRRKI